MGKFQYFHNPNKINQKMEKVPFHIQEISKLYEVIKSVNNNLADGKIENWASHFSPDHDLPKSGGYITLVTTIYFNFKHVNFSEVWVHLGNGYFKQCLKKQMDFPIWQVQTTKTL